MGAGPLGQAGMGAAFVLTSSSEDVRFSLMCYARRNAHLFISRVKPADDVWLLISANMKRKLCKGNGRPEEAA